jgi:hypothetical protein
MELAGEAWRFGAWLDEGLYLCRYTWLKIGT